MNVDELLRILPEYKQAKEQYRPDISVIEMMKSYVRAGDRMEVFMGTWCPDSLREVPKFLRIVDDLKTQFGVDLPVRVLCARQSKQEPKALMAGKSVDKVATFIYYRGDEEVGRIVERPVAAVRGRSADGRGEGAMKAAIGWWMQLGGHAPAADRALRRHGSRQRAHGSAVIGRWRRAFPGRPDVHARPRLMSSRSPRPTIDVGAGHRRGRRLLPRCRGWPTSGSSAPISMSRVVIFEIIGFYLDVEGGHLRDHRLLYR